MRDYAGNRTSNGPGIYRYSWGTFNPTHGCTYQQCNECGWNIDEREECITEIAPSLDKVIFYHDMCYHPCPDQKIIEVSE